MPIAEFPFRYIGRTSLGHIWRPYAVLQARTKDGQEWIPIEVVVDSGADYTLFPQRYADLLGIDLNVDCTPHTTLGIGGAESIYLYKTLAIKLERWRGAVPVGFLARDDVPALMGRLRMLEAMKINFHWNTPRLSASWRIGTPLKEGTMMVLLHRICV